MPRLLATLALSLLASPFLSENAHAQYADIRWEVLEPDEQEIVDLLAADFYEDSLRQSQAIAIEAHTSELYKDAAPEDRARFRAERRQSWDAMTEDEREALRDAKRPAYANLTEEQKAPFRAIAFDQLKAAGAIDEDALAAALRNEI